MEYIFPITDLNNDIDSFSFLSKLQYDTLHCEDSKIVWDFSKCNFSHAVFTSFIGAMNAICKGIGKQITYQFNLEKATYQYFHKSGLYDYLMHRDKHINTNQNALPFWRVDMHDNQLMDYIDTIIALSKIKISEEARQTLFRNIYELFVNAKDHSQEKHGVYACGHWMPKKQCLVFSIYDTGIGIPDLVKNKVDGNMSNMDALNWALVSGNSTRQFELGVPRGVGLADLKKFVAVNAGRLTILSSGVYYDYTANRQEVLEEFPWKSLGTLVCMTINQDKEHIYVNRK